MKMKALLLDIGNVCVRLRTQQFLDRVTPQGRPGLTQAEVLASLRDADSEHMLYEKGRLDGPGFHQALQRRLGLGLGYEAWLKEWNAYFEPNRPMESLLARLGGQLRLWALSNTNAEHLRHVRLNFRLFDAFEGYSASHEVGARKPEPVIYQHAIRSLGLPPEQVLYLDDVEDYVLAGRAQGLRAFHYRFNDAELRAELQQLGLDLPPLEGHSVMRC